MMIKKYRANSEEEAKKRAEEELGPNIIYLNSRVIKPSLIKRLFVRTKYEVTAAIDDVDEKVATVAEASKQDVSHTADTKSASYRFGEAFAKTDSEYSDDKTNAIEEKINTIAKLLEQQAANNSDRKDGIRGKQDSVKKEAADIHKALEDSPEKEQGTKGKVLELIHNQLLDNEVLEKHINSIIEELDFSEKNQALDNVLSSVYQKIVLKLGEIKPLEAGDNKPKIVYFVGNTGVGKTTTMAKLASKFKLDNKLKIAMLSVDTYRIAAIEQIKTYANILNTPMEVVYTPDDMRSMVDKYKDCDLIFVDTAGRSHKNKEQKEDLDSIINAVKDCEKEVFLVVSATTKYSDLKNIASVYGDMFDYRIIFTKLDETRGLGNILNLKLDTGKSLSYVTWGQNVPDDIGCLDPQIIAKKLLGGSE